MCVVLVVLFLGWCVYVDVVKLFGFVFGYYLFWGRFVFYLNFVGVDVILYFVVFGGWIVKYVGLMIVVICENLVVYLK